MSILNKYRSIANEGIFDGILDKIKKAREEAKEDQLTSDKFIERIKSSKGPYTSRSLPNKYKKVFAVSKQQDIINYLISSDKNLNEYDFVGLVNNLKTVFTQACEGLKAGKDEDDLNASASKKIVAAFKQHDKNGLSKSFIGNSKLNLIDDYFYRLEIDGYDGNMPETIESIAVEKTVKDLTSKLTKTITSKRNEIVKAAGIIFKTDDEAKRKYSEDVYEKATDITFYPISLADTLYLFLEEISESYTNVFKYLYHCTLTVSSESYSLEDGEETVTEEVQPELTETDETAENSSDEIVETSEGMEETSGRDSEENTESDLSVSGQEDSEVDSTSQQETGAPTEEPFQEEREVELDDPEVEKQEIIEYLSALLGDAVSELTLFSAGEVNRPLYHVSMNPNVRIFSPKVSSRTLSSEDRSVPRVSTSTSLIGCLNGYQSMFTDMAGRERKNFTGLYTVYELPYQYAVKPSKKLLSDVETSDEYWLVSWKKETYSIRPNTVCEFTIPQVQTTYGSDGEDQRVTMFLKVLGESLYLTHDIKLVKGYYEITLRNYDYDYPLENNNKIEVKEITENDYNKVTSLSIMIKKKG